MIDLTSVSTNAAAIADQAANRPSATRRGRPRLFSVVLARRASPIPDVARARVAHAAKAEPSAAAPIRVA
jgi:hypothetical protein